MKLPRFSVITGALVALLMIAGNTFGAGMTNYAENKILDTLFRGQAYTIPTTLYAAIDTTTGSDAACGTEVSGGSYARAAVTASMTNWAGTQSSNNTAASSGTNGTITNNGSITFPAPTGNWGTAVELCFYDAPTSGNPIIYGPLTVPKLISNGDAAPSFPAGSMTYQISN